MKRQLARLLIRTANLITHATTRVFSSLAATSLRSCGRKINIKPCQTVILNPENIDIGHNFNSAGKLYLHGNGGKIKIGDDCSFNSNVIIGASGSSISIGNNVLIGPNVVLRSADHTYADPRIPIRKQGHIGAEIIIEDDVWICSNCVITKGVIIGKGSVIAAGSIVTKSVAPYSVVGGVPAKLLKTRKDTTDPS